MKWCEIKFMGSTWTCQVLQVEMLVAANSWGAPNDGLPSFRSQYLNRVFLNQTPLLVDILKQTLFLMLSLFFFYSEFWEKL